jgi:hypothetical protein
MIGMAVAVVGDHGVVKWYLEPVEKRVAAAAIIVLRKARHAPLG